MVARHGRRGGQEGIKPPHPLLEPVLLVVLAFAFALGGGDARAHAGREAPAASPVTAADMVGVRGLSGMAVSPDGAFVALRQEEQRLDTNVTDLSWHVVPVHGGPAVRIASAGAPPLGGTGALEIERPVWSADSRWLYYRAIVGEEAQVWRAARDGSVQQQLTRDPADVRAFGVDGDRLHYAAAGATREEIRAAEAIEHDNGVLLDRSVIPGYAITKSFPVNGRMASFRRLDGGGYATLLHDRPLQLRSLDLASGAVSAAASDVAGGYAARWAVGDGRFYEGGSGRFSLPAQRATRVASMTSPGASHIASVDRRSPAPWPTSRSGVHLISREAAGGAETACLHHLCLDADNVGLLGWMPNGTEIVFQTATFGHEAIHLWDIRRGRIRTVLELDGVIGSQRSGATGVCQLSGEEAICIRSEAAVPARLVAISLRTGVERTLYDPNPGLARERFGLTEKITVADSYGGVAFGWLVIPRSRKPGERLPLVITSYACPGFLLGGSGGDVSEHVLAGRGYAAVCLDFGSFNIRRAPGTDMGAVGQDSMVDMFEDAVAVLDRRGIIDPERVALAGFSGSASAATYALTRSHRFAAAIVTTQGYLDPITAYLRGSTGESRSYFKAEGRKLPYDAREHGYYAKSPAWNADRITTPLLMQLADVEYPNMMQLFSTLLDYGRSVEMWIFPDAWHFKNLPRQRLAVYNRNVDWIEFWLRGTEAGLSGDDKQYRRWRTIKGAHCILPVMQTAKPWYCGAETAPIR